MEPTKNNTEQGAGNAGENRQALFTPPEIEQPVAQPRDTDTFHGSVVEPAHPYLSNHPTQTFNTDAGDIILNPVGAKPKQNKRPFIIGGAILVAFAVLCVLVMIISNMLGQNGKVFTLLKQNYENISWIEDFFADAYSGKLTMNEAFSSENHEKLNNSISSLSDLQKALAKVKSSSLKANAQQDFTLLKDELNERTPSYQNSVTLYNSLYDAYINNDSSILENTQSGENYYADITTKRFYNYIVEQAKLWLEIWRNGCDSANGSSELCQQLLEDYFDNIAELSSSTSVVTAIFTAYYDGPYTTENRFMPRVDTLLEELK